MRALGLILFLQCPFVVTSQTFFGARASGMASALISIPGYGIHSGNPASEKVHQVLVSSGGPSNISGLLHYTFVNHWFIKTYSLESGIERFGDEVASRDKIYAGFSHRKDHTSIGTRINLHQFRSIQSETEWDVTCSFGFITRLTEQISVGAWLDHLSIQSKPLTEDFLPLRMEVGATGALAENLLVGVTVCQQMDEKPIIKAGIEHQLAKKVQIRLGVSTVPYMVSAGIGFKYWKVTADFAGTYSTPLGIGLAATAGVQFK